MIELLSVFGTGFLSVFLLGFQSRLVNTGNRLWAGACSFTIAMAQSLLWSKLAVANHSFSSALAYGFSGFCGITLAMTVHKRVFKV
jgi:hypothetical protein